MKKFYITGVAGTGKTSIVKELSKRNIDAVDMDGLCYWIDQNGKKEKYEVGFGRNWVEAHEWICDKKKLKHFIDNAKSDLVVVAGIADDQDKYLSWFDKIFIVQCSRSVLQNRLINRNTNNFAKEKSEREYVLDLQKKYDKEMLSKGAIPINTEKNVKIVADQILAYI